MENTPTTLSLEDAKKLAITDGKKIRHRFFMPNEYLVYKNNEWWTEDDFQVPPNYWVSIPDYMLIGWLEHEEK